MALASTLTDIANLALAAIGEPAINNINDDSSVSNQVRSVLFEGIRQVQLLIEWPELRVTMKPTLDHYDEDTGLYHYNLPTNFLDVIDGGDDWQIDGKKLACSTVELTLIYKRYTSEPTEWGGNMTELIHKRISCMVVMPITQNVQLYQIHTEQFERARGVIVTRAQNRGRKQAQRPTQFQRNMRRG